MAMTSIGDLAASVLLRQRNSTLKADMARLSEELVSGRTATPAKTVQGNFRAISSIEQSISRLRAHDLVAKETEGLAGAMQTAFDGIVQRASDQASDMLLLSASGNAQHIGSISDTAEATFRDVVGKLNMQFAGRSLFAGVGTDTAALASADDLLTSLRGAIAGESTAAGVLSTLDAWFAPGGAYEGFLNPGAFTPMAPISVSADTDVALDTTASSTEVRDVLKGLAAGALLGDGLLPAQPDEQMALARAAGERLLAANDGLVHLQAKIGNAQERIEAASVEIAAESDAMQLALSRLLDVDPYDTATELQNVETQIELLYALTARAANLTLTDYL